MKKIVFAFLLVFPLEAFTQAQAVQNKIQKNIEKRLSQGPLKDLRKKESKILYEYKCHAQPQVLTEKAAKGEQPKEVKVSRKADKKFVIPFKSGQSSVEAEISRKIFGYLEDLKRAGSLSRVHIVGHTDSDRLGPKGQKKYGDNIGLSKARAMRVAQFIYKAYPDVAVSYNGFGFYRPVADNDTIEGKRKNRRVEVNFYLKKGFQLASDSSNKVKFKKTGKEDSSVPFKVTLDGEPLPGEVLKPSFKTSVDVQRCTDVALEGASLQIRYEPLVKEKYLNVTQSFKENRAIFLINSNYRAFIERADLYLYDAQSEEFLESFSFEKDKNSYRTLSVDLSTYKNRALSFKVKVFDNKKSFDETALQFISKFDDKINYSNLYQNRIAKSGIQIQGGTLSINGEGVPSSHSVYVMGKKVPLDQNGKFAEAQILKADTNYGIEISLEDKKGKGLYLKRDFYMPSHNWRAVALFDVTMGKNKSDGPVELITQDLQHYDNQVFFDGRVALYLKGKIKGDYLLTMQVDTLESTLEDAFDNINDKDPQKLFRRIDPDAYYPIYGDDSTLIEDSPSQGKFYVRVEKDENHILWGSFKLDSSPENLAHVQRGLYGFKLHLESSAQTKSGKKAASLDVYAAEPGTLPSREESRGTGGSVYYLRNQDIVEGSERVQIIVRDRVSGLIEGSRSLSRGTDYTLNSLAGIVYLKSPLSSTASSATVVSNNNISGDPVYLLVTYEYSPNFTETDRLVLGGRGELSLGSRLRLGATASKQDFVAAEHELYGLDASIKIGQMSSLKVESAQSKGFSPNQYTTIDGGFGFSQIPQTLNPDEEARALKAESHLKLYSLKNQTASLKAIYSAKDAGFASPGHLSIYKSTEMSSELNLPITEVLGLRASYGLRDQRLWLYSEEVTAEASLKIGKKLRADLGLLKDKIKDQSSGSASGTLATDFGERTDLGLKLTYQVDRNLSFYGRAQNTLSKDQTRLSNDRYGLGVTAKLGRKFKLSGEITDGDLDLGGKIETEYIQNENTNFYVNYLLENNRTDGGFAPRQMGRNGSLTSGVKSKFLEESTVFYENRMVDRFGSNRSQSLTHAVGLNWDLNTHWTYNITGEFGKVEAQDLSSRIDRTSASLSVGYVDKNTKWSSALEYRRDESGKSVRKTLVTKNRFLKKLNPSLRLKTKFDKIDSSATGGQFFDGDLTDAVVALAYRPIFQDSFNGLLKLRYFEALPSPGQVDASGNMPDYLQRSLVFNVDGVWDLSKRWSLGAKLGAAIRKQRNYREFSSFWLESNPKLAILRLDYHAPFKWDLHLEGRSLTNTAFEDARSGALVGIYRNFSQTGSLKLGMGYNFTDFSNDLTRLDANYKGWFINLVGAF